MAKIPSPIGPTIDVASKTISSSIIRGGAGGGGGGNVQPQTSAMVRRNTTDIVQLRKDHNALVKAQSASVSVFRNTIGNLSDQFKVINVSVRDLGSGVTGLNRGITTDTNLEVTKDRQELDRERRLAERGERVGKEKQLEQKLQQALLAPVQYISKRAQGILGNLMNAFTLFFLGWLSNKVIQILKDQSGKTTNIFKALFDGLIGGVTQYFKTLSFIGKVFANITRLVFGITKLISKTVIGGLGMLFNALRGLSKGAVNLFKGAGNAISNLFGRAGSKAATEAATEAGTEAATRAGTRAATEAAARGGSRLALSSIPVLGALPDFGFALADLYRGDYTSAMYSGLAGLATLSTPFTGGLGHVASLGLTGMSIKSSYDFDTARSEQNKPQSTPQTSRTPSPAASTSAPPPAPTAIPSTSLTPSPMQFSVDQTGLDMKFDSGESSTPPKTETAETNSPDKQQINLAQTQSIPSEPARVGPAPKPKPNIVTMSSLTANNNQSATVLRTSPGSVASEVPFVSSSNPDNFYTMYSQINYNVVI